MKAKEYRNQNDMEAEEEEENHEKVYKTQTATKKRKFKRFRFSEITGTTMVTASKLSEVLTGLKHTVTASLNEETMNLPRDSTLSQELNLFDVVSFWKENFVECCRRWSEACDTILCLSVTKWVHLNWGDDGLITLFAKIWRLLHPGGILILEAQNWKSYNSNHLVSEIAAFNYLNIEFPPSLFREMLWHKIEFRTVETITASSPGSTAGFNRAILIFCK